tara:strand:- start:772 stop:996 length:225 start_codon:yes stop_codon:yes gene_type:complete
MIGLPLAITFSTCGVSCTSGKNNYYLTIGEAKTTTHSESPLEREIMNSQPPNRDHLIGDHRYPGHHLPHHYRVH